LNVNSYIFTIQVYSTNAASNRALFASPTMQHVGATEVDILFSFR